MVRWIALAFALFAANGAAAHGVHIGPTTQSEFDPVVGAALVFSMLLYVAGVGSLWSKVGVGRGILHWQAGCFAAGWLVLVLALVSPLHDLAERLFTAHMIEHELLMAIAAPLLAVARPLGAFMWALPMTVRRALGAGARARLVTGAWLWVSTPLVATVVHGIAIWVWHVPVLFDAAVASTGLHRLQHLSFLATGLLFWWAMLRGRDYGVACAHVFATMFHMSLLGALITLSSRLWYVPNGGAALAFGLSPIEDQQLGGLIMWIPAGTVYAGAGLVLAGRWIARANTATILEDAHELARR